MLFYEQAAAGTLPAFSWISPKHEAADHPCLDLAKGERMLKDIYEALRGGKAWEKTLFVVTYDDYGGVCKCGNMWQPALCCSQPPAVRCVSAVPHRMMPSCAPSAPGSVLSQLYCGSPGPAPRSALVPAPAPAPAGASPPRRRLTLRSPFVCWTRGQRGARSRSGPI